MRMAFASLLAALASGCTSGGGAAWTPAAAPAVADAPAPSLGDETAAPEERRYEIFMASRAAGALVIRDRAGEGYSADYSYNDRGRGDELTVEAALDDAGALRALRITGKDYGKAPVDEQFEVAQGRAAWRTTSDRGEAAAGAGAFYLPLHATPAEIEALASALLASEERSLALYPAGTAAIREIETLEVERGGAAERVTLYAIRGLSLDEYYVWLDAKRRLFADAGSWFSVVREGWSPVVERLLARQDEDVLASLKERAARLAQHPPAGLAIRDVAVFDPASGKLLPKQTVVVVGDRIEAVGPARRVTVPEGAWVVDGRGHTLLPGLWDMHVHVGRNEGALHLAAGVTSARDLGNDFEDAVATRDEFERGEVIGPRLILSGFLDGPGEMTAPTGEVVDTEQEVRAAIEKFAEAGYEQIKVYSSIRPALVPSIIEQAHARHLRVSGHIPAFMTAAQAVAAGFDEIQHANMLFLNFLDVKDTRTPARFTSVAEQAAEIDLDGEPMKAFIALLRERDVIVDPTLAIFESKFTARLGAPAPGYAMVIDRFPVRLQRAFRTGGMPVPEGMDERYRRAHRAMLDLVGRLHRAGVRLVAGTDSLAGFTLHRELELYVEAGISTRDVLRIATLGAAEITGRADRLGTIAPGKLADLVLVQGDPVADMAAVRRTALTIKGGTLYIPKQLYEPYGIRHDVPPPAIAR